MYEGLVCVCCFDSEEDQLLELFSQNQDDGDDDYSSLLWDCFRIQVLVREGHSHVCVRCAARLRDAAEFRRQIVATLALLNPRFNEVHTAPHSGQVCDSELPATLESEFTSGGCGGNTEKKPKDKRAYQRRERRKKTKSKDHNYENSSKKQIKKESTEGPILLRPKPLFPTYKLDATEFKCRECDAEFRSAHTLAEHTNTHYANYGCRACGKAFMTTGGWSRHQRTHAAGPFPCPRCDKVFRTENTRLSHVRLLHGRTLAFACAQCGQRFRTFYRRAAHARDAHGHKDRYACPHCSETFLVATWRARHVRMKHRREQFACKLCSFTSKWKEVVRNHLASKHQVGEKQYRCGYCGKRYARRTTIKEHIRTHLDDRKYKCEFCHRSYVQKASLNAHLQGHLRRKEITQEQYENTDTAPSARIVTFKEIMAKMQEDNPEQTEKDNGKIIDEEYEKYICIKLLDDNKMAVLKEGGNEHRDALSDIEGEYSEYECEYIDDSEMGEIDEEL